MEVKLNLKSKKATAILHEEQRRKSWGFRYASKYKLVRLEVEAKLRSRSVDLSLSPLSTATSTSTDGLSRGKRDADWGKRRFSPTT